MIASVDGGEGDSPSGGVRQWTIRHPNGRIEAKGTATSFGPTEDKQEALTRLETADSDCMCRDDDDERRHVLVTRFVPAPTAWTVGENEHSDG